MEAGHRGAIAPLVAMIGFVAWAQPVTADFDRAMAAAMPPYYGALVSSARGDAESTQRHLWLPVATSPRSPVRATP